MRLGRRLQHRAPARWPDNDLIHIDVRGVEQSAAFCRGKHGDGIVGAESAEIRSFKRIDRDVDLRSLLVAHGLADEQHGRLVALALPDHDSAVNRELVKLTAHCVHCRLIGGFLISAPGQSSSRYGSALGHAHDLKRKDALEGKMGMDGDGRRYVARVSGHFSSQLPPCC